MNTDRVGSWMMHRKWIARTIAALALAAAATSLSARQLGSRPAEDWIGRLEHRHGPRRVRRPEAARARRRRRAVPRRAASHQESRGISEGDGAIREAERPNRDR